MNYDLDTETGMRNAMIWTLGHIRQLRNGGMWVIPRSNTAVQLNKIARHATITPGYTPDPSIARVFEAMGWTVVEK